MYEFDELKNLGTLQCEISVSLSLYFFQFDASESALLTTELQSGRFQSDCSHKKIVNHSKLTLHLYKIHGSIRFEKSPNGNSSDCQSLNTIELLHLHCMDKNTLTV